jgi:predicted RNase H-like HicB family nuclease
MMNHQLTMIYWKNQNFWLGKIQEYPEIMTQGETLEELEENLRDAYHEMILEDVPSEYQSKLIAV